MLTYDSLRNKLPDLFANENSPLKIITDRKIREKWQAEKILELRNQNLPESWSQIGVVFDDPYLVILRDLVEFPDGNLHGYFRVINRADLNGGQGVVIFCTMGNKFLLLHQYRHPTRSWSFEVPRGFGEPGVSAENQARQEVHEEVEGEIGKIIDLGIYYSNTGLEANKVRLFYATLTSIGKPAVNEGIESFQWVSLSELENMIANEEITDGFTIAAYTRAKLKGLLDRI